MFLSKLRHACQVNFANLVLAFHHATGPDGQLTTEHITQLAPDIIGVGNFARSVYADVAPVMHGDVVAIPQALAASVSKHIGLIPKDFLTAANVANISTVCATICNLPVTQVEDAIKLQLGIK